MRALAAALERAVGGAGSLALVSGEAGIGKTTLASRIAAEAAAQGVEVLWGRCVEFEGTPVYWCWRQVLRDWAEARPRDEVLEVLGPTASDVARIAPEIGVDPSPLDDDDARFRLFDSVSGWLRRASKARPLLLVLEDVHWADGAALRLLEFVAGGLAQTGALVLATYRDTDVAPDSPLAAALGASLRPGPSTPHVPLAGLSQAEVALLATEAFGHSLASAAHEVTAHTGGNPLFATEVLRLLAAGAALSAGVPSTVRAVILDRVKRLGADGERILTGAAVLGARFSARALVRLVGDQAAVEKVLDGACRVALLAEDDHAVDGYRFVHDLVREALYDQVSRADKRAMHMAAGEALEAAGDSDPETLAAHFLAAGSEKAMPYAAAAAEHAVGRLAFDEAAALYRSALSLWPSRDERRAGLLTALGEALFHADHAPAAKEAFIDAADVAEELGDARLMARALLGIGSGRLHGRPEYDVPVPRLERNLALLGSRDPALRAQLLSRMADMVTDRVESFRLAEEAVATLRGVDSPDTRVLALARRFLAFPYADTLAARRAAVDEMLAAARAGVDPQRTYDARCMSTRLLLEAGELDRAVTEAEILDRDTDLGRGSLLLRMVEPVGANVATLQGDFDKAQQHITGLLNRAGERGRTEVVWDAVQVQLLAVLWHQGMLEALHITLAQAVDALPEDPGVYPPAGTLIIDAELGHRDAALSLLHGRVGPDLAKWQYTWGGNDMVALSWIAEACGLLRDGTFAERLHELLLPAADRMIVAGMPPVVAMGWGTLPLGITAGLLGRHELAESYFAEAHDRHAQMGAHVLVARTDFHWAQASASAGRADQAHALATSAEAAATRLGLAALARHAGALLVRDEPPASGAVFKREGEFWTVSFEGGVARLKDSLGMRHIAALLASPGTERHVLELAAEGGAGFGLAPAAGAQAPLLDAQAKAAYRRRIAALTEERDEAASCNDLARAEKAEAELEALIAQLRGALGLGGRDRAAAAESERARISVSRAVKTALSRIDDALPDLGTHLRATIRTGTFCSYVPDPRVPVPWTL
jgi:tetratricopeptide (TPR) repeat protein